MTNCYWVDDSVGTSNGTVVLIVNSGSVSSNYLDVIYYEDEEELKERAKIAARLRNNARASAQARALHSTHEKKPDLPTPPERVERVPRLTYRRTKTGVRNFRVL